MLPNSDKKPLAVGTEDFAEMRRSGCYYVDKTRLIVNLLLSPAKATLFTRPRRFGKTLNMSMLKSFFEIGGDPALFDGLAVSRETGLCEKYMGKFPVISISLKDVAGGPGQPGFLLARNLLCDIIGETVSQFRFLLDSDRLNADEKEKYRNLTRVDGGSGGQYSMTDAVLSGSLRTLSVLLEKHYGKKVVLLIDEYDVPLQKAFYGGYYDEMVRLIRGMFSQALKTNPSLQFAVLTGCLRISKESIFTGMNNLRVMTVAHEEFSGCFGFTDREVRELLEYYELADCYGTVREWYDGYRFGSAEVYCPWDVVNYVSRLLMNPKARPENFWANSSGNDAVREFVQRLDTGSTRKELQLLVEGGTVRREIRLELTYRDMYSSVENLWSLLYMTGYLTGGPAGDDGIGISLYDLFVPNTEIRGIFMSQIMELFREETKKDGESLERLCRALADGDAAGVEKSFDFYLRRVISVRDTSARNDRKENFYHGILLGVLSYKASWIVSSNRETGDGYGDILVEAEDGSIGIVIEVKYAQDGNLDRGVELALQQIETRRYDEKLRDDGIEKLLKYGIACYKKRCRVALG